MPRINFADTQEGWIFCGYRILNYKWERCRVLLNPADAIEVAKLEKMAVKLQDELVFEMSRDNRNKNNTVSKTDYDIVAQTAGERYAGPMIQGRFQVMEGFIKGSYYIADHNRDDLLLRVAGLASDTKRFPSIAAAEDFIRESFTDTIHPVISRSPARKPAAIERKDTGIMSLDITSEGELAAENAAPPLATIPAVSEPATVPWDGVSPAPVPAPKRIRKPAPSRSVSGDKPIVEAKKPRVVKETVKPAAPAKAKKPAPVKAKKPAPVKVAAKPAPIAKVAPVKTSKVALPGLSAKSPAKPAPIAKVGPKKLLKSAPVPVVKVAAKPVKAAPKQPAKVVKAAPVKAPAKAVKPASGEPKKIGRPLTTGTATISSLTRDLLLKGKLTDKAIIAKAKEKFPDAAIAHNLVAVIRGKLVKAGVAVPPRKV